MDKFSVPKAINKSVVKAVDILQCTQNGFVQAERIKEQVKIQLRFASPIRYMDTYIHQSLNNLTNVGVLAQTGIGEYALRHTLQFGGAVGKAVPTPYTNAPGAPGFPLRRAVQNLRRKRSHGRLDPWTQVMETLSRDSISGTNMEQARKRLRTNTKRLVKQKKRFHLPKAIQHESADKFILRNSSQTHVILKRKCTRPTLTLCERCHLMLEDNHVEWQDKAVRKSGAPISMDLDCGYVSETERPMSSKSEPTFHSIVDLNKVQLDRKNASVLGLCGSIQRVSSNPNFLGNQYDSNLKKILRDESNSCPNFDFYS